MSFQINQKLVRKWQENTAKSCRTRDNAGLADIAPYHMILGNHDMNLKNSGRLDAISPIVDYLDHPNIHFHKYASVVEVADGIDLHVLSIVDPENWQKNLPEDRVRS